jgi:4-diphosphocytidyl-2-C-methyl-D-erythritol kinase
MIALQAHAKINLWLRVLAREAATGYHQIETAFCALRLSDDLAFENSGNGFELIVEGADLGDPDHNLVTRAARAFRDATRCETPVRVRLTKNIPVGAGLGGGSSDAACTLIALNRIHGWPLSASALHGLACRLGADVPFFLSGAAMALAWGRGDRLLTVPAPAPATVVLICPATPVSTAAAYEAVSRAAPSLPVAPVASDDLLSWDAIAGCTHNDFERVVSRWIPDFARIRSAILDAGARFAHLAGSGSAVFGLFLEPPGPALLDHLQALFPEAVTLQTQTRATTQRGVDPPPRRG